MEIWNLDLSEPLESVPEDRFDLVAAMAILEHLPSSPRPLLLNAKALLSENGRLVVDVPNIAYWPNRIGLLRGISPLPRMADVYHSEPPFTGHHHEYTVDELVDVLTWSGLSVDEIVTLNYTPWPDRRLLRIAADWPRKRFARMRGAAGLRVARLAAGFLAARDEVPAEQVAGHARERPRDLIVVRGAHLVDPQPSSPKSSRISRFVYPFVPSLSMWAESTAARLRKGFPASSAWRTHMP